jgi:multisubunit Na+/H+ antiporter MnhG subunit
VSDPEETAPFTHQPYGGKPEDNPFVSPSGPAAQPSGPSYVQPPVPPPPTTVPYGPPQPGHPQPWAAGWAPVYGAPYPGSQDHKGATTALVLGIVSIGSLVLALFCCVTAPGILCAPFAWAVGAKAKREIERAPGVYGNLGAAVTGMWMGVVMTVLGLLAVAAAVALLAFIGLADPTLV